MGTCEWSAVPVLSVIRRSITVQPSSKEPVKQPKYNQEITKTSNSISKQPDRDSFPDQVKRVVVIN